MTLAGLEYMCANVRRAFARSDDGTPAYWMHARTWGERVRNWRKHGGRLRLVK